jgi:hypothetical protein
MSLEEIDDMDYRRLTQALAAQSILELESRRLLLMRGQIKELSDEDAERIAYHDELVEATGDDADGSEDA